LIFNSEDRKTLREIDIYKKIRQAVKRLETEARIETDIPNGYM